MESFVFKLLFWISIFTLFFTYFGYPMSLWVLVKFKRQNIRKQTNDVNDLPFISLFIPAYNEEAVIRRKIVNSLDLDYPSTKLEIVVASDGSNDRTNKMLKSFGKQEIRSIIYRQRTGKTGLINRTIPKLTGEIIVFSDASAILKPDAITQIVKRFSNARVGCVSGTYQIQNEDDSNRGKGEGLYFRYETGMKRMESELSSILGAHGSLYAIRKHLFRPLKDNTINDDYIIPMQIVEQGFRSVYEKKAIASEIASTDIKGEMNRRIRISAGNIQQIFFLKKLLNPLNQGIIAFEFFSHKFLRLISPLSMIIALGSSAMINTPFFRVATFLQIIFYGAGVANFYLEKHGIKFKLLMIPFYFVMGAITTLRGFNRYRKLSASTILWDRSDTISQGMK